MLGSWEADVGRVDQKRLGGGQAHVEQVELVSE